MYASTCGVNIGLNSVRMSLEATSQFKGRELFLRTEKKKRKKNISIHNISYTPRKFERVITIKRQL